MSRTTAIKLSSNYFHSAVKHTLACCSSDCLVIEDLVSLKSNDLPISQPRCPVNPCWICALIFQLLLQSQPELAISLLDSFTNGRIVPCKFVKVSRDSPRRKCLGENSTRGDPLCPGCIVERTTSSLGWKGSPVSLVRPSGEPKIDFETTTNEQRARIQTQRCSMPRCFFSRQTSTKQTSGTDASLSQFFFSFFFSFLFFFFFFFKSSTYCPVDLFHQWIVKGLRRNRAHEFRATIFLIASPLEYLRGCTFKAAPWDSGHSTGPSSNSRL